MFKKIKYFFRKKEYYATDYNSLNTYSIEFTEVNDVDLKNISDKILSFQESDSIENDKANLFVNEAIKFSTIENLMIDIKRIIEEDYRETYFEAKNENWIFNYFLSYPKMIYKDTLMISNRIQDVNGNIGDVIYPILAIRKYNGKYYLWNLLGKEVDNS